MEFFTTLLMLHLLVDEHNRPAHPYRAPYKMSVDMAAVLDFDNDPSKWRRLKVVQIVPFCDLEKKKNGKNSFQIIIFFFTAISFYLYTFFALGRMHRSVILFSFIPHTKIVSNRSHSLKVLCEKIFFSMVAKRL